MLDHILSDFVLPAGLLGSMFGGFLYAWLSTSAYEVAREFYPGQLQELSGVMASNLGQGLRAFSAMPALLKPRFIETLPSGSHRMLFQVTRIVRTLMYVSMMAFVGSLILISWLSSHH